MNTTAEVYLWNTRVGIIHQELNKPYASFEYDTDFQIEGIMIDREKTEIDHEKIEKKLKFISFFVTRHRM